MDGVSRYRYRSICSKCGALWEPRNGAYDFLPRCLGRARRFSGRKPTKAMDSSEADGMESFGSRGIKLTLFSGFTCFILVKKVGVYPFIIHTYIQEGNPHPTQLRGVLLYLVSSTQGAS